MGGNSVSHSASMGGHTSLASPPSSSDFASAADSCYSSCSESESHSSLSRNTSAASETLAAEYLLSNDLTRKLNMGPPVPAPVDDPRWDPESEEDKRILKVRKLGEFVTKLGFSQRQLWAVLGKLSGPLNQDRVLAELTKLGRETPSPPLQEQGPSQPQLRPIVIDGSNVAYSHGRKEVYSCRGIKECVDYFRSRGHDDVKVFLPQHRRETQRADSPITELETMLELDSDGLIIWTPSRRIAGRGALCQDDRFILRTALDNGGVLVSDADYRDTLKDSPEFRPVIEDQLLLYSWKDGKFMPSDDPLGRGGQNVDCFLRWSGSASSASAPLCPYARKCTYGNKCKFAHPERPGGVHVSVTQRLRDRNNRKLQLSATPSLNPPTASKTPAFRTHSLNPSLFARHQSPSPGRDAEPCQPPSSQPPPVLQRSAVSRQLSNPEPLGGRRPGIGQAWACPPSAALLSVVQEQHQGLVRNRSAPGTGVPANGRERAECGSDSQLHRWGGEGGPGALSAENPLSGSHLFVPSSAVWGPMEFSVAPVYPGESGSSRERLLYHLSQLFPVDVVRQVLAANPSLEDPHHLCALILARQSNHHSS